MISCKKEAPEVKNVYVANMTPTEFRQRLADCPIAYLPLGTIEWHGEHLPLGTDMLIPLNFFELLAEELGGIVYPSLFLGPDMHQNIEGKDYYGMDIQRKDKKGDSLPPRQLEGSSYWVSDSIFKSILENVLMHIQRNGFKILVAHGHGPSGGMVAKYTEEFEKKFNLKIFVCWGYMSGEKWNKMDQDGLGIMVDHAAANETSLMMHFVPQFVKMNQLSPDTEIWPEAILGKDPREFANPELGKKIILMQKDRMIQLLKDELKNCSKK